MAGYTNSAGNSSASNQLSQFRYFTSSMDKLGTYKATNVNIPLPRVDIPQQVNWAATAANTLIKGMGIYEAYRDQQYKRAEEYLNTHSIEDYKKSMVEGEVPFQYDYLAMTKLKEGYGKIVFNLAAQDFKNKVDRNYFQGKSPEEVDAAFYQQLQDSVKEFDDGTLGFSTDDYFFNQGVYAKANETRVGMMVEHAKVEDDYLQQQFEQQTIAQIKDLANDPNKSIDDITAGIKDILSTTYRSSPEAQYKYLQTLLTELGSNPNGDTILENIGGLEVAEGTTLREYMGEAEFQKARVNAESFRFKTDAQYRMVFQQKIDGFVRDGNVNAIQAALNAHIKENGNVQDAEYEYMLRALGQAQDVQLRGLSAAHGLANRERAAALWQQYYRDVAADKEVPTQEVFKQYVDSICGSGSYSANDLKVFQQMAVNACLESGDPKVIGTVLSVANRDATNNREMASYVGDFFSNSMRDINNAINKLSTGSQLTDEERQGVSKTLSGVLSLYTMNPSATVNSLKGGNKENLFNLRIMDMAVRNGKDPIKLMADLETANRAMRDESYTKSGGKFSSANFQITNKDLSKAYDDMDFGNLSATLHYNDYLTAEAKVRAVTLKSIDPSTSFDDCIKAAKEQVLAEYAPIQGTSIIMPKTLLRDTVLDSALESVPIDSYMETANETLVNILTKNGTGIKAASDYSDSFLGYDENDNLVVHVVDYLGNSRGTVSLEAWSKATNEAVKNKAITAGQEIMKANSEVYKVPRSEEEIIEAKNKYGLSYPGAYLMLLNR